MRLKKTIISVAVLLGAAIYVWWPGTAPDLSQPVKLHLSEARSFGSDTGQGNVVGISPVMEPSDYASATRFEEKLDGYFDSAAAEGWFQEKTIVLLPEHLGTGLVAVGAKSRSLSRHGVTDAALPLIAANIVDYLKNWLIFDDGDSISAALVRTRNRAAADAIRQTFGNLARRYGVSIVAGSSAIMTPGAYPDSLSYGHGPIFNAAFVFGPDGLPIIDATRKITPAPWEAGIVTPSHVRFLFPYDIGGRRAAVLIGQDSQAADALGHSAGQATDLLLVPSFLPSGAAVTDQPDLAAFYARYGIQWGMQVTLRGSLWGFDGAGKTWVLENGLLWEPEDITRTDASIYNLWLR